MKTKARPGLNLVKRTLFLSRAETAAQTPMANAESPFSLEEGEVCTWTWIWVPWPGFIPDSSPAPNLHS